MNAKEAREMTEERIIKSSDGTKAKIDKSINDAIASHKFSVNVNVPPTYERSFIESHYKSLGYAWKHVVPDQKDGGASYIQISW